MTIFHASGKLLSHDMIFHMKLLHNCISNLYTFPVTFLPYLLTLSLKSAENAKGANSRMRTESIPYLQIRGGFHKIWLLFLFLHENLCCGNSLEVPQWGTNKYPNIFSWRDKKNINTFQMKKKCLIWCYGTQDQGITWGFSIIQGLLPYQFSGERMCTILVKCLAD